MLCSTDISNRQQRRQVKAFTMIEIVLSLAVIAVAMVAIIGVLPLGMNVQSENREISIVNTDAGLWIEAIRGGAQGMDYLANNVLDVGITETRRNLSDNSLLSGPTTTYFTNFTSGSNLLGVLSYPKYRLEGTNVLVERTAYADVRALNGNMGDLIADDDFSFNYRMSTELVPSRPYSTEPFQGVMQTNLYDLRLNFAWPLLPGAGGKSRDQTRFSKDITLRTLVSGGQLIITNELDSSERFYFMNPRHFEYDPQ